MTTMPMLKFTVGDETVDVAVSRVDLLRLERIDEVSAAEVFVKPTLTLIYKMAWLALQRTKHPTVEPFVDLAAVTARDLVAGAEALSEVAEVEATPEAGAPKD